MRLQLTIQRHTLPPVHVLWTVGVVRPPYAAAGASATVSQLLEQINEIIPLESEDWGLEDYAVEVRGFECLHFSELGQILREDDEVCVRPLQTSDLRFRKISGRHQISTNGGHLIDGVPFGRPFLRLNDRPAIRIPPRKRRRVTYEDDDSDHKEYLGGSQMVIHEGPADIDNNLTESGSEDDDEFLPDEEGDIKLSAELEDICNDKTENGGSPVFVERTIDLDGLEEAPGRLTRSRQANRRGLGLQGEVMLKLVDENGRPYPAEYNNPLLDLFRKDEPAIPTQLSSKRKRSRSTPKFCGQENTAQNIYKSKPDCVNRRSSSSSHKNARHEDADSTTPATIREIEDTDSSDDDFEPTRDFVLGLEDSDKENSQPHGNIELSVSSSNGTSSSSSLSSQMDSDSDETSSSGSSTTSSSSNFELEQLPPTLYEPVRNSETPSQFSSVSSNAHSPAKKPGQETNGKGVAIPFVSIKHDDSTMEVSNIKIVPDTQPVQGSQPPYQGKNHTRQRNQRRRDSKRLKYLKSMGILPQTATAVDLQQLQREETMIVERTPELREESHSNRVALTTDLESKRDALLLLVTSGSGDTPRDSHQEQASVSVLTNDVQSEIYNVTTDDPETALADEQPEEMQGVQPKTPRKCTNGAASIEKNTRVDGIATLSKPRSKLDIDSSRRMVFGSLGLSTPKTKEDEWSMRQKLMNDTKPQKVLQFQTKDKTAEPYIAVESDNDESWRDNIILKAVECSYDGVELSTPPFPFVQRWDPQQQIGYTGQSGMKARRNKKRKRKSEKFYQQVSKHKPMGGKTTAHSISGSGIENYGDEHDTKPPIAHQQQLALRRESNDYETAISDQLLRETEESAIASAEPENGQDLPVLSQDMSTFQPLTKEASTPGAVIAFKQLDMSQETNWQPTVSEYRTALVDRLMDNEMIRMTLAQRDQPQIEKVYDQQTGERIYSKFEMPGYNDEELFLNGVIELSFAELIEPKLVQAANNKPNEENTQKILARDQEGCFVAEPDIATKESADLSPIPSNITKTELFEGSLDNSNTEVGHEGVRKTIFELIKDAGWRSSIGSNIEKERCPQEIPTGKSQTDGNDDKPLHSSTPSFHDFSSSPPIGRRVDTGLGLLNREKLLKDNASSPQSGNDFEIAESLPTTRFTEQHVFQARSEDQDLSWDESQLKSDSPEVDHQVSSQELPSFTCPQHSMAPIVHPSNGGLHQNSPINPVHTSDGAELDEFPMVEDIFSQIMSSNEPLSLAHEDSNFVGDSSYEIMTPKEERNLSLRCQNAKPNGKENFSQKQILFKWDDEEDETTPRASQAPLQSQVVDLTLSSDPADVADSDYVDDGTQLPEGPGWVKKTRASMGCSEIAATGYGMSRRTRSTSYGAFS